MPEPEHPTSSRAKDVSTGAAAAASAGADGCGDAMPTDSIRQLDQLVRSQPDRIGPYKIVEVIGEGGMGVVYKAEQREPIRRTVALKLIKLGMDTEEVIARF